MPLVIERGTVPSGTIQLFFNTAAPSGWTKITDPSANDAAIRIVTGTASSGGSTVFSTRYNTAAQSISIGSTSLNSASFPAHSHKIPINTGGSTSFGDNKSFDWSLPGDAGTNLSTETIGSGSSHNHSASFVFSVNYVNLILCSKD